MEAAVDGSGGDGVFAAAINANDGMVAAASVVPTEITYMDTEDIQIKYIVS
jgi:hypothetical protein